LRGVISAKFIFSNVLQSISIRTIPIGQSPSMVYNRVVSIVMRLLVSTRPPYEREHGIRNIPLLGLIIILLGIGLYVYYRFTRKGGAPEESG